MSLVMLHSPNSAAARAYRALRANVLLELGSDTASLLMVTAPDEVVNAAVLASNVAVAFAQAEKRVLLVDAHLYRPACHALFGLAVAPGLSEYAHDLQSQPFLQSAQPAPFLQVMAAGTCQVDPSDLLSSPRLSQALAALRPLADVIVLHAPPTVYQESALLASLADGVVLAVAAGRSRRADVRRAQELLKRANARVLGAVLMH